MGRSDPLAAFASGRADADPGAEQARRELEAQLPEGLTVDAAACFPDFSGKSAIRANQKRLGYLHGAAPLLRACLEPGETIRYFCLGREHVWWETLGAGHWAALLSRKLLFATDRRLLYVHSDGKGAVLRYVNQIPKSAIKKVKGMLASCTFVLGKGRRVFQLTIGERKLLELAFDGENPNASGGVELLCPACFTPHAEHVEQCSSCRAPFKSPKTAGLRSLLVPGLGAFYSGSKGHGWLQALRGGMLWLVVLGTLAGGAAGDRELLQLGVVFACLLPLELGISALMARALAKRGLIALDLRLPASRGA